MSRQMLDRRIAPPVHELTQVDFPQISQLSLQNGIKLYVYNRDDIDILNMSIVTNGGLAESGNPACAVLTSLLNQEGTINRSGREIADTLELKGAWTSFEPSSHHHRINCVSLKENFPEVASIIADILFNPTFPEDEFENLKSLMAVKAETNSDRVRWQAEVLSDKMTFGENHPLAKVCDAQAFLKSTIYEVRKFYRTFLHPSEICIFIVGSMDDKIIDIIQERFGSFVSNSMQLSYLTVESFSPQAAPLVKVRRMEGKLQSAINITVPYNQMPYEDSLKMRMVNMTLGGYFGSRLQQNIREDKGLTYGIQSIFHRYIDGNVLSVITECANENVNKILDEVSLEIDRLCVQYIDREELMRVRGAEVAELSEIVSSPFAAMNFFISMKLLGLPDSYFADRLHTALSTTSEEIIELTRKYLQSDMLLTAIAGDPI